MELPRERERRICGNAGAGNENFYNFVKIFTTERGEEMTLGTEEQVLGAGAGGRLSFVMGTAL